MFDFCNGCPIINECGYRQDKMKHLQDFFCPIRDILEIHQKDANIPARYKEVSLSSNISFRVNLKGFSDDLLNFVDERGDNLLISGASLSGKTMLGCAILNQYIIKKMRKLKGKTLVYEYPLALYQDFSVLCDLLRYDKKEEQVTELMNNVMNTPLLLLDGIDLVNVSQFVTEQANMLLNYRFNNKLSTILISTESFKDCLSKFKCNALEKLVKCSRQIIL